MKRKILAIATATAAALLAAGGTHASEQAIPFGSWGKQETVRISTQNDGAPDDSAPLRTYTHATTMSCATAIRRV
jgi:hypothetical protein